MPERVNKPWGFYEDFYRSDKVVFKKIVIEPYACISFQVHSERGEFWFIEQGPALFKFSTQSEDQLKNYSLKEVKDGETIEVPPGVAHQIIADSIPVIIWEMQYGKCSETDIVRLEDPYKR